ncbi:MAG: DNA mismatch repair protein MutS [Alphaproteobacteria bacterium GM7ARS4]|nr:DNA mismatch repair protein MutS [Alphaproteobacteria bacterium GM7ARS4]
MSEEQPSHAITTQEAHGREKKMPIGDTPSISQYKEFKAQYPDAILFYQMGDFYEMFFDDAHVVSEALNIRCVHRGKSAGRDIPMCGVPIHSSESYLMSLVKKGFKVAIIQQKEGGDDSQKRGKLFEREFVRLVTPGTLTEESLLDAKTHNYLMSWALVGKTLGCVWIDVSTGHFQAHSWEAEASQQQNVYAKAMALCVGLDPREIILSRPMAEDDDCYDALRDWWKRVTVIEDYVSSSENAKRELVALWGESFARSLHLYDRASLMAAAVTVRYIKRTQRGALPVIQELRQFSLRHSMVIDPTTLRSLEIVSSMHGERKNTLMATLDRTVSAAGGRLMTRRLTTPSLCLDTIRERLAHVGYFYTHEAVRHRMISCLKRVHDIERALARLAVQRGSPRDLGALRDTLACAAQMAMVMRKIKEETPSPDVPDGLCAFETPLAELGALHATLQAALSHDLPLHAHGGGFISTAYDTVLQNTLRELAEHKRHITRLQDDYRSKTHIDSLRIVYVEKENSYIIEITRSQLQKLKATNTKHFMARRSTKHVARFTTEELEARQNARLTLDNAVRQEEMRIYHDLCALAQRHSHALHRLADALAHLDVVSSHASYAWDYDWHAPSVDDSDDLSIVGGRHPVLEPQEGTEFVANDCLLTGENRLWLLTGPNMAGKSTFLRQNALIIILAQAGFYVPAKKAHIGLVETIFSRVGSGDNLAKGESTFMVEMKETEVILRLANKKSFVILDEIGRGTAVRDGLALAWSIIEHIHTVNQARGIFATHYHELAAVQENLTALSLRQMVVDKRGEKIFFRHLIRPGSASGSYGIYVAQLAGIPHAVCVRAQSVMAMLDDIDSKYHQGLKGMAPDVHMVAPEQPKAEIWTMLDALDPDKHTPRDALEILYKLKEAFNKEKG